MREETGRRLIYTGEETVTREAGAGVTPTTQGTPTAPEPEETWDVPPRALTGVPVLLKHLDCSPADADLGLSAPEQRE